MFVQHDLCVPTFLIPQFKKLFAQLGIVPIFGDSFEATFEGQVIQVSYLTFSQRNDDILKKIVKHWLTNFKSGSYRIMEADQLLSFKQRCKKMGLPTGFGANFWCNYKAYIDILAWETLVEV